MFRFFNSTVKMAAASGSGARSCSSLPLRVGEYGFGLCNTKGDQLHFSHSLVGADPHTLSWDEDLTGSFNSLLELTQEQQENQFLYVRSGDNAQIKHYSYNVFMGLVDGYRGGMPESELQSGVVNLLSEPTGPRLSI